MCPSGSSCTWSGRRVAGDSCPNQEKVSAERGSRARARAGETPLPAFAPGSLGVLKAPLRRFSRGRFSVVKKCDQKGTKQAVAAKFVNKKLMKRDQVTHELGVLRSVQHPLLVSLLDTFETPTSYVLVLEMCVLRALARSW